MFFFEFGQIMYWAFWSALGAMIFGFWMVVFSNTVTWAVNFCNDNKNREYQWWYERMIMHSWNGATWNEDHQRWLTENYKDFFGPTDEDSNLRGNRRFAYWFGTGMSYGLFYFPCTLILGVCLYFWFAAIPIFIVVLGALYMRRVVRRRKAAAAEKELEEKQVEENAQ